MTAPLGAAARLVIDGREHGKSAMLTRRTFPKFESFDVHRGLRIPDLRE
jgi:hypothetical protein